MGGQTDAQARTQFSLWCVMAAPLIISQDVLSWSAYALETYSNAELIAVSQDPLGAPGRRLAGSNLTYPCSGNGLPPGAIAAVQAMPCNASDPRQQWAYNSSSGQWHSALGGVLDDYECGAADGTAVLVYPPDNGTGTCNGRNQQWTTDGAQVVNAAVQKCLDIYDFAGPAVDVWTCNGGLNQAWAQPGDGTLRSQQAPPNNLCLAATQPDATACSNVWGRPLADGSWALAFINNGAAASIVACDAACFSQTTLPSGPGAALVVRDLWAHANVTTLPWTPGGYSYNASVPGDGGVVAVRLIPV